MDKDQKNKIKLAVLMLVAIIPITFATMSFRNAMLEGGIGGSLNKGELINPPIDVSALDMNDEMGVPMFKPFEEVIEALGDEEYEIQPWLMVYVSGSDCNQACLDRIFQLRQLHVALGKDIQRVRRYFLNASGNDISVENKQLFREEYPSMGVAHGDPQKIKQNFAQAKVDLNLPEEDYVIFVDPVGNTMMYYSADKTAQDIMSDLETLLRHSSLG